MPRQALVARSAQRARFEFRLEAFNLLNRANFGVPELRAFAGQADSEAPLATFGRITTTVTSARQIQLSVRVRFLIFFFFFKILK